LICIYQRLDHIYGDTSNATPFLKKKRMESKVNTPAIIMVTGAVSNYLVAVKPLKWLYLSMLHPETPEVMKLLSNALGNTQKYFTCIKFLPRNMQTPTFISFKVGMSEDLFEKILDPAVWFYRVAIREFVSWPRKFLRPSVVRIFLQTRKLNMDKDREVDAAIPCYTFENDSIVAPPLCTIFSDDGVDTDDGNTLSRSPLIDVHVAIYFQNVNRLRTSLVSSLHDEELFDARYFVFRCGVLIVVQRTFDISELSTKNQSLVEHECVRIKCDKFFLYISAVYLAPDVGKRVPTTYLWKTLNLSRTTVTSVTSFWLSVTSKCRKSDERLTKTAALCCP
jgi:hypothetical protein